MARRKRMLDDGDDSDSGANSDEPDIDFDNDPDAREERALFENPYGNKRRRRNDKEDALYGIFAENSDDEAEKRPSGSRSKRSDWAKAPAFITSNKPVKLDEPMVVDSDEGEGEDEADHASSDSGDEDEDDGEAGGSEGEGETREDAEYSDESEPSRPPSPRVRIEEEEEQMPGPRMGGIGSSKSQATGPPSFSSREGIGSWNNDAAAPLSGVLKGGIGSQRGGIGARTTTTTTTATTITTEYSMDWEGSPSNQAPSSNITDSPSSFSSKSQSFVRAAKPPPSVALPAAELAHFSKISTSFGARMLAKMGWQAGTGLGTTGEGIIIPIESKLRPQKMGIAFKGFKEKTAQSKLEAKRRGEIVSDDEDEKVKKHRRKVKEQQDKRSYAWKRPKKVKSKTEHKTYEQILEEAGEAPAASGIGQIIDATGVVPREVSSLADINLNSWAPTNDVTRIPEVRHNVRLIAEACKSDLDGLAREAKALRERKQFVISEDARLRKRVEDEAELIARLQQIQIVANDINTVAKDVASLHEVSLEPFSPLFQKLILEYSPEYDKYRLDELVVAAMAPAMRRMTAAWDPLEDPLRFLSTFRSWRRALKINDEPPPPKTEIDVYGTQTTARPDDLQKPMTPFESLLWNVWLPKVRTSINNNWAPEDPQPAVRFYEAWSSFLPPFIRDNLLDQLVLPKVQKAVANWNAKTTKVSLRAIVFPWLPYVGLRLEDVVGDARRKIKNLLRNWTIEEPIPTDLSAWKEVFDAGEWDSMLLKHVVPKLGATLRNDFRVNPRDQKMKPLENVLAWSSIIRSSIFAQLLQTEFFPKWLDVLYIWLIQPRVSFGEVADWFSKWKDVFPEPVRNLSGVNRGFTRGLQLMNKAIEFGPDAPTKLEKPDFVGEISVPSTPIHAGKETEKNLKPSARAHEITFRSIVEEYAASHNLLFIPAGKAHEISRMPLFRVSRTVDGRKGLMVYILDDAVWAPKTDAAHVEREEFKAISLEDMILRAT
ncbi:TFP11-domain-containing protein [Pholiota conissans]|uniref:TFP11-domain-containing protein n=1 Tax=Pholiota conissans TaxID=109636 RepID=A0A9P6CUH1_9AGAR|nr:TFP11-domain-containing protein [Pholiota conissans]